MCLACSGSNRPEASVAARREMGWHTSPLCILSNRRISDNIFAFPTGFSSKFHHPRCVCGILVQARMCGA